MKKIMIFNGSPRKNGNTAALIESFTKGAKSVSDDIEVKDIRLYDIDFKGCRSCFGCKMKEKEKKVCIVKDALAPVLQEANEADALVFASPIFMHRATGIFF